MPPYKDQISPLLEKTSKAFPAHSKATQPLSSQGLETGLIIHTISYKGFRGYYREIKVPPVTSMDGLKCLSLSSNNSLSQGHIIWQSLSRPLAPHWFIYVIYWELLKNCFSQSAKCTDGSTLSAFKNQNHIVVSQICSCSLTEI